VTKKTNTTIWADREPGPGERYLYLWDPKANVYLEKIAPIDVDPAEEAEKAFVARLEDRDVHPELYQDEEPEDAPEDAEAPPTEDPLADLRKAVPIIIGRATVEKLAAALVPFIWGQIVVGGTINLFAGGPSSGKSTLLFLLLAARSSTNPHPIDILTFPCAPAPSDKFLVLIEGEHSEGSTARKLLKSFDLVDAPLDGLDRVVTIARKGVTIGSLAWRRILNLAARGLVSDVFLDTLARVSPPENEADNETGQVEVFNRLSELIECAPGGSLTIWIAAHTRKSGTGKDARSRVDVDDVSGSAQRVGQCDTLIGIWGKKNGSRTVDFLKLREEPDAYPDEVTYRIEGTELTIESGGTSTTPPVPAEEDGPAARIVSHLRTHPEKDFTISSLRKIGGSAGGKLNTAHAEKIMSNLVKSGRVAHTQNGDDEVYKWAHYEDATPGFSPTGGNNTDE
jgi:hypothetical protein